MFFHLPAFHALQDKDLKKLQEAWDGRDIDAPLMKNMGLLHVACGFGHLDIVRWVLEQGANPSLLTSEGQTPLTIAAAVHREETVELLTLLLDHGADLSDQFILRSPLLHYLCDSADRSHNVEVLELLHKRGLDLNVSDINGNNALHSIIIASGKTTLVGQWLVEKGIDIHHRNQEGWTPTMVCFKWGPSALLQVLLEKGGSTDESVDGKNFFQHQTPRHIHNRAVFDAFVSKQELEGKMPSPPPTLSKSIRL